MKKIGSAPSQSSRSSIDVVRLCAACPLARQCRTACRDAAKLLARRPVKR